MRMVTPPLERGFASPMVKPGAVCGVLPMMCHIQCNIPSLYVKGKNANDRSFLGGPSGCPSGAEFSHNTEAIRWSGAARAGLLGQ